MMPVVQAKRHVNHGAQRMFDLVADIERYPEFVPLCERHVIRSRESRGPIEILVTDMTVGYEVFRASHRSRVTLDRPNGRILVESGGGLLRRLRTVWTFESRCENCCDVGFDLSYELESAVLSFLLGGVLDSAFGRFVQAFERRADALYGRPSLPPKRAAARAAPRSRLI